MVVFVVDNPPPIGKPGFTVKIVMFVMFVVVGPCFMWGGSMRGDPFGVLFDALQR